MMLGADKPQSEGDDELDRLGHRRAGSRGAPRAAQYGGATAALGMAVAKGMTFRPSVETSNVIPSPSFHSETTPKNQNTSRNRQAQSSTSVVSSINEKYSKPTTSTTTTTKKTAAVPKTKRDGYVPPTPLGYDEPKGSRKELEWVPPPPPVQQEQTFVPPTSRTDEFVLHFGSGSSVSSRSHHSNYDPPTPSFETAKGRKREPASNKSTSSNYVPPQTLDKREISSSRTPYVPPSGFQPMPQRQLPERAWTSSEYSTYLRPSYLHASPTGDEQPENPSHLSGASFNVKASRGDEKPQYLTYLSAPSLRSSAAPHGNTGDLLHRPSTGDEKLKNVVRLDDPPSRGNTSDYRPFAGDPSNPSFRSAVPSTQKTMADAVHRASAGDDMPPRVTRRSDSLLRSAVPPTVAKHVHRESTGDQKPNNSPRLNDSSFEGTSNPTFRTTPGWKGNWKGSKGGSNGIPGISQMKNRPVGVKNFPTQEVVATPCRFNSIVSEVTFMSREDDDGDSQGTRGSVGVQQEVVSRKPRTNFLTASVGTPRDLLTDDELARVESRDRTHKLQGVQEELYSREDDDVLFDLSRHDNGFKNPGEKGSRPRGLQRAQEEAYSREKNIPDEDELPFDLLSRRDNGFNNHNPGQRPRGFRREGEFFSREGYDEHDQVSFDLTARSGNNLDLTQRTIKLHGFQRGQKESYSREATIPDDDDESFDLLSRHDNGFKTRNLENSTNPDRTRQRQMPYRLNNTATRMTAEETAKQSSSATRNATPKLNSRGRVGGLQPQGGNMDDQNEKTLQSREPTQTGRRLSSYISSEGFGQRSQSYVGSVSSDPYHKYFKMLGFGVPMRAVKNHMWFDGYEPSELDDFHYKRVRYLESHKTPEGWSEIWEGPHVKFFKMLNAGVPLEAVKQRMTIDGLDPNNLNVDLYKKVQKQIRSDDGVYEEGKDADSSHHKYFVMLTRGKTMKEVKDEVKRDGLDPSFMDKYQYRPVVFTYEGEANELEMDDEIDMESHVGDDDGGSCKQNWDAAPPEFKKFFKMLCVGVPMRSVKNHMLSDGYDPDSLDDYSYRRIRWLTDRPRDEAWRDIWESEYTTYYKMLYLGVPLEAVRQRMHLEGYDSTTLDMEVFQRVKRQMREEGFHYDEGQEDVHHKKYFHMLSGGIIMRRVKQAMADDGLDPSVLDIYQYKPIMT